jgi:alpha-mannosidase
MKYYLFNRPVKGRLEIPPVFSWKAADGSSVAAERIGGEYLAWTKPGIEFNLRESKEMLETYDYDRMAVFYGVGNHGGGPTIDNIRSIYELREESPDDLDFSTMKEFFDTVDKEQLPVHQGELGRIFMGCYSSDNEIKRLNRRAEWSLIKAEAVGAIAARLSGDSNQYPKTDMEKAWKMTLFNQFHDILSGTSMETARNDACQEFGYALATSRQVISNGIQAIANNVDTRGDGFPLVLINPTGNEFKGVFFADVYVSSANRKQVRMRGTDGDEIPYAEITAPYYARDGRKGILFEAEVPAMGYAVYRVLQEGPNFKPAESNMTADGRTISNGILTLTLDEKTGCPASMIRNGVELLSAPAYFGVFNDDRGAWGVEFLEEKQEGAFEAQSIRVIETNFLRTVVRSILTYQKSELVVDYIMEKGSDILKMNCSIHNHERHAEICYCVPVNGNNHQVTTETAFFAETRVIGDGTEYYQHRFADVVNDKQQGIAVINNCAYGMSQKENVYRLIISRSVMFARGDEGPVDITPDIRFMDQGCWDFTLELLPHDTEITKQRLFVEADFLHMPVDYLGDSNHTGKHWLRKDSALTVNGEGVHLSCFKLSEEEGSEIVRIFETKGQETTAQIKSGSREFEVTLSPYQVKSFAVKGNKIKECSMIEKDLEPVK